MNWGWKERAYCSGISIATVLAGMGIAFLVTDIGTAVMPDSSSETSVTDLMEQTGCEGDVIETQMFSKETGRCSIDGKELTIAIFEDEDNRDRWTDAAEGYGYSSAVGEDWAVVGTFDSKDILESFSTAVAGDEE